LDTTFGKGGTVNVAGVGGCTALALLSSGEIQVVNAQATAQFTANGAPEPVTGGTILESAGSEQPSAANIFEPNGDYLFADLLFTGAPRGHNAAAQVLRFTPIGNPDPNFANPSFHYNGTGGSGIEASANGLAVAPNGDIVVVGQQNTTTGTILNGLARLTSGGTLDPTFGNGGTVANTIPAGTQGLMGVVIQPVDGKIVAIGTANNLTQLTISRYLGN